MPLYEFKCSKCETFFEVLVMKKDDDREIACPECQSTEFERVLSTMNYAHGSSGRPQASVQDRTCSSGSCSTYSIPGVD